MKKTGMAHTKKAIAAICLTGMSVSMLAGCGDDKEAGAGTATPATGASAGAAASSAPAEPLKLNVMMIQQLAEPPKKDAAALKKMEEYTNTKLDISWVPGAGTNYDDKVSATIASGTMPDLLLLRKLKESAQLNAQLSGVFWDVTPFLKDTKNLSKMSEVAKTNAGVNGQLFGIPRERVLARYGMIFRKDWLDALGLQQPKTVDDIYNVAKAFTLNDPDKNGKNDTFGIQEDATMELLKQLVLYAGGPNGWGLLDGKVSPDFLHPEFKPALDLYKKMISEKIIMPDFPIAKKYDYFNQEKAGIYFAVLDDAYTRHVDLQKKNPKVVVDVALNFDGAKGQRVRGTFGYDSMLVIPKQSVKTEAKVKQIIDYIDKLGDEPMQTLLKWGVEGVDYTVEGGKAKKIEGAAGIGDFLNFKWDTPNSGLAGNKTALEEKVDKLIADNKQLAIVDMSASLLSETNLQKGSELKKGMTDAQTKYVLGELDEAGWNSAIEKWRKDGGDKVIEEFTAAYNKAKK
ncbi:MAG: ytcQ 2 [Paenibacillaceae bacterium]|jgi:putative aldouronate transport system substrate-binding protein|nr:ytcQ 2 [Paenibacillaceae bacterium]